MKKSLFVLVSVLFVMVACQPAPIILPLTSTPTAPIPTVPSPQPLTSPPEFVWRVNGNSVNFFYKPGGLALDLQGNLYMWDGGNLRVQVFDRNGKVLMSWGGRGNADGQFDVSGDYPLGSIAVDQQGNVYVPDYGNDRVQKFDNHGKFIAKWGTRGSADGEFIAPFGVAVDKEGRVYVIDDGTARLQVFDGEGRFLSKFGSRGTGDGQFQNPSYITVDSQGNVYIPDYDTGRVQKFNRDGILIAKWNATCGSGEQIMPYAIAVDGKGNAYITDHEHFRVCTFDSQGHFLFSWGGQGTGAAFQITNPSGIVVDNQGNIYVAGGLPPHVQKFRQP